jgi:lysophospholipase L1-like esterase
MNLSLYTVVACLLITVMAGSVKVNASGTSTIVTKDTGKTWLALGDSYTIGQSVPYEDNYPEQTMSVLNDSGIHFMHPEIIATTGWTTGDLLGAIAGKPVPATPYDIVTLLIGVNNQYQGGSLTEYQTQFTTLLQQSIAYAGNKASHVIVISIPDYAFTPFGKSAGDGARISYQVNAFNAINKQVTENYGARYIDVTDLSRKTGTDPAFIANDGLHYSAKEYHLWSEVLVTAIQQALY